MQEIIVSYRQIGSTNYLNFSVELAQGIPSYELEDRLIERLNNEINPGKSLATLVASKSRGQTATQMPSNQEILKHWGIEAFYESVGKQHNFIH